MNEIFKISPPHETTIYKNNFQYDAWYQMDLFYKDQSAKFLAPGSHLMSLAL